MNRRSFLKFCGIAPAVPMVAVEALENQSMFWMFSPYIDWGQYMTKTFLLQISVEDRATPYIKSWMPGMDKNMNAIADPSMCNVKFPITSLVWHEITAEQLSNIKKFPVPVLLTLGQWSKFKDECHSRNIPIPEPRTTATNT